MVDAVEVVKGLDVDVSVGIFCSPGMLWLLEL